MCKLAEELKDEGRTEGKIEGQLELIVKLIKDGIISTEEAIRNYGFNEQDLQKNLNK